MTSDRLATSSPSRVSGSMRTAVRALAERVQARDHQPPLSDQALTRLESEQVRHVLVTAGDEVVGYAQLDGTSLELLADPPAVLEPLLAAVEPDAPAGLEVWSHGRRSPVGATLAARGYRRERVLHQLRAVLGTGSDTGPDTGPWPPGVQVRTFDIGHDEQAWLALNAAAFAHHPEQGSWTAADLQAREAEPWFDPAGFLLAERNGILLAFHWTKVHEDGLGEVYVLGVDPAAQGLGLGRLLLDAGLRHLFDRGVRGVLLYVDDDNTTAVRLYERAGFERYDADTQWRRP